jgi:flagellar protein FlaJ
LNNIYLHGSSSETLKRLTDDLLVRQKIESKEFSGKMVVYALVFIAVSAIMPSMFQSFILIGSYFMKISFTPLQVLAIVVILFPALDISILFMIHSKTPIFLRQ